MDQAEASGRTVDDALSRALTQIGATREDIDAERVQFDVLDEGRKGGLFGRGARDAVVRVNRAGGTGGAPDDRRAAPDTRVPRGQTQQPRGRRSDAAPRGREGDGDRPRGRGPGPGRATSSRAPLDTAVPRLREEDFHRAPRYDEETGEAATPPAPTRPAGDAPASRRGPARDRPAGERPERERRRREDEPNVDPDINAEEVEFAAGVVDDLLRILDIDVELTIREPLTPGDGKGMSLAVIDINGADLGLLIGRRGETLSALQYLVNLIVNRRYPDRPGVTIDVEHYKHRREEQVVSLARRMADRVRQTGSAITLEPMTAAERRLVHITLAEDPELSTNSIGEGDNRKVVISTRG